MSLSESDAPETITLKTAKAQSKRQNKEREERQQLFVARFATIYSTNFDNHHV